MRRNPSNATNAINVPSVIRLKKDTDAVSVPLKTDKISLAGCVESTVTMYAGFFFACLNMVCGNLDTQESFGLPLFEKKMSLSLTVNFRSQRL